MELYFLRHGEAEPPGPAGDEARELTAEGRDDVRATAEALVRVRATAERICASPLIRARQTAEIAATAFGVSWQVDERLRPGARLGEVQALLASGRWRRIMLVGHEPDLSTIIAQLTGGRVRMRTAALARVDLATAEPGAGVLVWLISSDVLGTK